MLRPGAWLRMAALAVLMILALAVVVHGQDAPPADQAQPASPAKQAPKKTKPAPKPPIKAGEVMPFDQPDAAAQQEPAPAAKPDSAAAKPEPAIKSEPAAPKPEAPAPEPRKTKASPAAAEAAKKVAPVRQAKAGSAVTIGALLPLSGPQAAMGQSARVAMELAASDLNEELSQSGSPFNVTLAIEDTASSKAQALAKIKALAVAGVRLVIGPGSDDEVDAVIDFAGKNGMLLLSPWSAGPYLAKPGDSLLRFAPSDAYQAEAIAVLANQEGSTQLIPIWVGDMYGDEIITHVKGQFVNLGGEILPGTRFRPGETKFQNYVADLKAQITKGVKDKKKLAILVAARGEQTASILREAAKLGGLDDVKWYGSDDSALRGAIVQEQDVAQFAAKVRMAFARYGETGTALYTNLEKRLEERLKAFVDTQSMVAYDLTRLAAQASFVSGGDPEPLKLAVPALAERYYGASGWLALNENGDRREDYDFDFWTIKNIEGTYYWVKTARYQFDPGSVKQLIMNESEKQ